MTKRETKKEIKNIGVIDLSQIDFADNFIQIFIPIVNISAELKTELDKAIEVDKVNYLEEMKELGCKRLLDSEWSSKGVIFDGLSMEVLVQDKEIRYSINVDYTDMENDFLWNNASIEVDLSAFNDEIKKIVIKAMIDKFF